MVTPEIQELIEKLTKSTNDGTGKTTGWLWLIHSESHTSKSWALFPNIDKGDGRVIWFETAEEAAWEWLRQRFRS